MDKEFKIVEKDLKILVVDDEQLFRHGMEVFFIMQGYMHVRTASNGEEALEAIKEESPDLVFLDLYLPGMNGFRVLKEIRNIAPDTKVLMLTSESDEEFLHQALKLGAYDYLTKPLTLASIFKRLETCLQQRFQPTA